jgi:GMP synthase-like glutamine amidotransferase
MNVQVFQHSSSEGLGAIEPWLRGRGAEIATTQFFAGALPPPIESIDALIVMGGAMSANDEGELPWLRGEKRFIAQAVERGLPVLGVCLGSQLIANVLGGRVFPNANREIGWFPVLRTPDAAAHRLGACLPREAEVFHWHGETFTLPPGAVHLMRSAACENQAFAVGANVLGVQFHPEITEESAREWFDDAGDRLGTGPYVTSAEAAMKSPERFGRTHALLGRILDRFFSVGAAL